MNSRPINETGRSSHPGNFLQFLQWLQSGVGFFWMMVLMAAIIMVTAEVYFLHRLGRERIPASGEETKAASVFLAKECPMHDVEMRQRILTTWKNREPASGDPMEKEQVERYVASCQNEIDNSTAEDRAQRAKIAATIEAERAAKRKAHLDQLEALSIIGR